MMSSCKVAVVGTGYVGLVTGACLAGWGHNVTCIDLNELRIKRLQRGEVPIFEPGLEELVHENTAEGRLCFSTSLQAGIAGADCIFLAVGTPPRSSDGHADLSFLFTAATDIANLLPDGSRSVIVIKSTVPVGTGDRVEQMIESLRPGLGVRVISNPEFLREGNAVADFEGPDRIIIGGNDVEAVSQIRRLYAKAENNGAAVIVTSRASAEMIKYASNAFLATKIAFINEIADLCELTDADIGDVSTGMGSDHRIGMQFLNPGPGYGGSCFPKDTLALAKSAQDHGCRFGIVNETIASNEARKSRMAAKVVAALGESVEGKRIAVFGLAFKANTDDVRDSPAIPLIRTLQELGAGISACDPKAVHQARLVLDGVDFFEDPVRCAEGCDAVVVVTEWDCFKNLNLAQLASAMRGNHLIDLRRIIDREQAELAGFSVVTLGQGRQRKLSGNAKVAVKSNTLHATGKPSRSLHIAGQSENAPAAGRSLQGIDLILVQGGQRSGQAEIHTDESENVSQQAF